MPSYFEKSAKTSFSLVEFLIVVVIMIILTVIAVPTFISFQKQSDLASSAEDMAGALRLVQNRTLASEDDSSWGVYFSDTSSPNEYTLFEGADYLTRIVSSDDIRKLPSTVMISSISLTGGGQEVVFSRITGVTSQDGSIVLELSDDPTKNRTIYISETGKIELTSPSVPSDSSRTKDSRHVHVDYSKLIATSTDVLNLTFDGATVEQIVLAESLRGSQIYWEREVDVAGSIQKVKIHSHRLNNPDTQLCIHRDRRYNNTTLKVENVSDPTGFLVDYSADGLTISTSSIYVADPIWQ